MSRKKRGRAKTTTGRKRTPSKEKKSTKGKEKEKEKEKEKKDDKDQREENHEDKQKRKMEKKVAKEESERSDEEEGSESEEQQTDRVTDAILYFNIGKRKNALGISLSLFLSFLIFNVHNIPIVTSERGMNKRQIKPRDFIAVGEEDSELDEFSSEYSDSEEGSCNDDIDAESSQSSEEE